MRKSNRRKRNYIIVGLCAILLIMVVGYAAFSSQLKISGTSSISSSWDIEITNIETMLPSEVGGEGISDGYNINEPTYTPTSATFSAGFKLPGSEIAYVVEVSNLGSIDGQVTIGNLNCGDNSAIYCYASAMDENPLNSEPTNGFDFNEGNHDYSDISFALKTGKKHYIVIGVYYDDVTEQPNDLNTNIKLDLTYEQYKDPSILIPTGETTIIGGQEVDIVSGGDGLYKDEYEDGKYTYKGANPNNYITFNNEAWRIISVDSTGLIKIMRTGTPGTRAWDSSNSNQWTRPADINTYLNGEYLSKFIKTNKEKIVSHAWSIGGITSENTDLANQIQDENGTKSENESIGMITVSEYLRANSNVQQCENISINNANSSACLKTNWMYNILPIGGSLWTITADNSNSTNVFRISNHDNIGGVGNINSITAISRNNYYSSGYSPTLYLTSAITLTGDGSQENPYVITN